MPWERNRQHLTSLTGRGRREGGREGGRRKGERGREGLTNVKFANNYNNFFFNSCLSSITE